MICTLILNDVIACNCVCNKIVYCRVMCMVAMLEDVSQNVAWSPRRDKKITVCSGALYLSEC